MSEYKLHCGNCLSILPTIPDGSIDLTITSPPYGEMRSYNGYEFNFEGIAQELFRVTKPGGVLVWVVGDQTIDGSETGTSFRQALFFKDICGFNILDTMIYRKLNGAMGSNITYLQEFEFMFVLSKGIPKTVNFLRDRKNVETTRKDAPLRKSTPNGKVAQRIDIVRQEYGRRKNIWDYAVGGTQEFGYHPAPFPKGLAKDHILSWSNEGDTILDPMCGRGTVGVEALQYQRNFIGIDVSSEYLEIAEKSISIVQAQLHLPIS